jgi:hypothetical protein
MHHPQTQFISDRSTKVSWRDLTSRKSHFEVVSKEKEILLPDHTTRAINENADRWSHN